MAARLRGCDWIGLEAGLHERGHAVLPKLLQARECRELAAYFPEQERFRSRVIMQRLAFGHGEYKYFSYPLPPSVANLRSAFYPHLVTVANRWHEALGIDLRFPDDHATFLARCRTAGQDRPTPLLLRYEEGGYNCLHQDLYGELVFPLQVTVLLSRPGRDFDGGEFVLTEQRPRMQSRAEVLHLEQGDAVVFAVRHRPVRGRRGHYRVNLRHGISRVKRGRRYALGLIFHDAA